MLSRILTKTTPSTFIKTTSLRTFNSKRGFADAATSTIDPEASQIVHSDDAQFHIDLEQQHVACYYKHVPVVIDRGERCFLYDIDGKRYFDYICGFASVGQGHCHPKIVEALINQANKVTQYSRTFFGTELSTFSKQICDLLGFEMFLPQSSGCESCESAIKVARRWGYVKKNIPENQATIYLAERNFMGRSITACSGSSDPGRMKQFGPGTTGFGIVPYNDVDAIEERLKNDPNCCAIMLESIQGEGGIIVPDDGYLLKVRKLCDQYNALLIVDEIQTGLGRTGKLMAYEYDLGPNIKPDIVVLGKAISGGVTPVSGILGSRDTLGLINYGEHGSTFSGNPLGMAVAKAAVQVIVDEGLVEKAEARGNQLMGNLRDMNCPLIKDIRGRGLLTAIEFHDGLKHNGNEFSNILLKNGILARASYVNMMRFSPALVTTEAEIDESCEIIHESLKEFEAINQ